jgi:MYXO-CTERM domain-containing protein
MKTPVLCAMALTTLSGAASAALLLFTGTLEGTQEAPPNASPGTGAVSLSIDDATFIWTLTGSYSGLTGTTTASHIHGPADVGVIAGVVVGLTHTGGSNGSLSGGGTFLPAQFAELQAGRYYVNVHTTLFPGGEVRAQLTQVPEPAAAGLAGLAALGLLARRRRALA